MKKTKLAFFSIFPIEFSGGFEKYMVEVSRLLLKTNNFEKISIINFNNEFYEKMCRKISFTPLYKLLPVYRAKLSEIQKKIPGVDIVKINPSELKKTLSEYDVIYTKNELVELYYLKKAKIKKKLIAGVHTPLVFNHYTAYSLVHNILYGKFIYGRLAKFVNIFHVINKASKKYLSGRSGNKEVRLIYNPFEFEKFYKKSEKYKYKHQWKQDKFNILWMSRLIQNKGVSELIKIIQEINNRPESKSIVWNIVGNGLMADEITKIAKQYKNVNYLGFIENKYIPNVLKNNDLFITTSHSEGFPYTVLEAQAMNKPVISFDIPGCNDIIEPGKTGYLAKNLDEFEQLILKSAKEKPNKDISKIIIKKFNQAKIIEQLVEMLTK